MDSTVEDKDKEVEEVDEGNTLSDYLYVFVDKWYWFVLSAIVCLVLARVYLATQNNVYSRQAVMLVKEDDNSSNGRRSGISTDALMQLNGVIAGSSVKNEVYILQSHQLVQEVVLRLHLDMFYSCKRGLRTVSLYKDKPFDVRFLSGFRAPVSMKIVPVDANTCRISEVSMGAVQYDYDKTINYNEPQHTAFGRFVVMPVTANLSDFKGVPIMVNRVSLETATNCYRGAVNTGEIDKESTLVKLTCTDTNMQRADDILSALLDAYKKSIIDDKNRIALSTEQFINSRIGAIHEELSRVEGNLASFKQRNRLIDFQQNATAYLTEGTKAKDQTTQLQSQLGVAENLMIFLKDAANGRELIPAISGVGDAALQNNIAKYNEMMLERNRLASNSSESSPVLREATQSLNSMRSTIIASMSGYISSLRVQLGHAQMVQNTMNSTISDVPGQEKVAQDITRQQGIKEALYTYLLNKREETELQLAITEANIRVIDQPFGSFYPVAPRRGLIQLAALIIGIIFPFVFFRIKDMLNMGVRGRKDIERYTTIPVLGEVPHRDSRVGDEEIVVKKDADDPLAEGFRMMRFGLNYVGKDAHVIMFTSTVPGEGKTFVSRNFAVTLSLLGKSVVLIDTDIRKRTQTRLSGIHGHAGLTTYLCGDTDDISTLLVKGDDNFPVDVIPAGVVPPNPAEMLSDGRLDQLVAALRKQYDYVILDSVPALAVADAGIVNRVAELTVYVIREGKIDRRYLPELEKMHREDKFNHLCIVVNDSHTDNRKHGYGYGYGYGYGHNHGYGLGYGDKTYARRRFRHILRK